ncbi:MAG TPA: AraC family transcriptional regulator [Gemmatimonadaceae bacterium]|nr:AraC family transcriptional regulator [Gemmatimonadaceae bacterium]
MVQQSSGTLLFQVGPVAGLETTLPPGTRLDAHEHATPFLSCLLEGSFEQPAPDGLHHMTAGDVRATPEGDRNRLRFGSAGGRCFLVALESHERQGLPPIDDRAFIRDGRAAGSVLRLRAEVLAARPCPLAIESAALELFALVRRRGRSPRGAHAPPAWLLRVRQRIEEEFTRPLDLERLAVEGGVSREQVARAFRDHFGRTVGSYLRHVRLRRAVEGLASSDESIAAVAAGAGFVDQAHLTHTLRRAVGLTPARARALLRQGSGLPTSRRYKTAAFLRPIHSAVR